jgi:hypothetical protein
MGRCCLRGFADHLRDGGGENRWRAARPGRIFKQALDAEREKPPAPQCRHAHADVEFGGNLEILQPVSGEQNDAAAQSDTHRNRTAASLPLKFFAPRPFALALTQFSGAKFVDVLAPGEDWPPRPVTPGATVSTLVGFRPGRGKSSSAVVLSVSSKRLSEVSSRGACEVIVRVDEADATVRTKGMSKSWFAVRTTRVVTGENPCTVVYTV